MKKSVIYAALLAAIASVGCGNKQDANDKNFGVAIGQFLDKRGDLCMSPSFTHDKWPVDLSQIELSMEKTMPSGPAGQMAALAAVGLASQSDIEVDQIAWTGKPTGNKIKMKRYALTDTGKKFYHEKQGVLCYGKESLDKVVKWDIPQSLGGALITNVKYLYKIEGLADWANNADVQAAFPYIRTMIDGAGKQEQAQGIKLTNQGWEALGLE
ncbi:MAG: hypothetical protein H7240_03970 [Glaciimonas sp.]|nr:hypothetical protein [Glaciimonas sp.]